jgi:hypothetical protein
VRYQVQSCRAGSFNPTAYWAGSSLRRTSFAFFGIVRTMGDHHILILSILLGMAAAGIVFGVLLMHAHG